MLVIILMLAAIECFLNLKASNISSNFSKIKALKSNKVFVDHEAESSKNKQKVLFLGNSYQIFGLDKKKINTNFASKYNIEYIDFIGSQIADWYWIYRNFVSDTPNSPIEIFIPITWYNLVEGKDLNIRRLARIVSWTDSIDVSENNLVGFKQKTDFLLSKLFITYCLKDSVKKKVLTYFIPNYKFVTRLINEEGKKLVESQSKCSKMKISYNTLNRFLKLVQTRGDNVTFIYMPRKGIDKNGIKKQIAYFNKHNINYINAISFVDINEKNFIDPAHMSESGAKIFTRKLIKILPSYLYKK